MRLFSSFVTNLIPEITMEHKRFDRILKLLNQLRSINTIINASLSDCHAKMKELSKTAAKEDKADLEQELREKSTALAVN